MKISEHLKLPETRDIDDLDDPQSSEIHRRIIQQKPFLKNVYIDFYKQFEMAFDKSVGGSAVEIGSGGGFLKEILPKVITSDILGLSNIEVCFSLEKMPFADNSVGHFFMLNVFHHANDAQTFLAEMNRCLKPGGKIIMIEPTNTPWSRFVHRNFHHELFDTEAAWNLHEKGPMTSANSALPWIVFQRDKELFKERFPNLTIEKLKFHTPLRYVLSGGVSMKSLVPAFSYNIFKIIEYIISPLNRLIGMFFTIEIRKID